MSDEEMEGLNFDNRTTTNDFHERLLRARESDERDQMNDQINFNEFFDTNNTDELQQQLKTLQEQVERMEGKVVDMENKIATRKKKRDVEASLTNMSPEERAEYVEQQEKEDNENTPDFDVIFEYMLLLSSTPADDINDFSATDLIKPHAGIRKQALESDQVKKQEKYSMLHFTKANNILEVNTEGEGEIRHCELGGTTNNIEFSITFDVLEPSMAMTNLVFDVNIEVQLEIGEVLEKIKEECNLMGFFRLLVHYGLIEKERKLVFDNLTEKYSNTHIHVELLSQSRIMFEDTTSAYLILEWKTVTVNTDRYRLDANVTDHVQPQVSLELANLGATNDLDTIILANEMNERFLNLSKLVGVHQAVDMIINKTFMPFEET